MLALDPAVQERLIGRPARDVLTPADRDRLRGQRVLITGAGGSIGGELVRQIASCAPASLTLVDHAEYALFTIDAELRERHPRLPLEARLGDVGRRADMAAACRAARPHVVYHAAAYKHVVLAEHAIVAVARTNVLGTYETARAAREAGARIVLVSSDKAAEPRSVMGASKRLADLVALAPAAPDTRAIAVRFGNILGSRGSLLEVMARCVRHGRNIPITHPDATRFFMTGQEAVSLVLKADLMATHAEIFWLDMGPAVRIGDLAARFIAWSASTGAAPVGIDLIGLRPGEKMREDLTSQGLEMRRTAHPRIRSARPRPLDRAAIAATLRDLRRAVARGDAAGVLATIGAAVPDFSVDPATLDAARDTAAPPVLARGA